MLSFQMWQYGDTIIIIIVVVLPMKGSHIFFIFTSMPCTFYLGIRPVLVSKEAQLAKFDE